MHQHGTEVEQKMKRIPLFASVLVILAVLATTAFARPLASRNGVVVGYSPGKSLTIHTDGVDMTYIVRGNMFANVNGIATGAHVTVWAECFGGMNSAAAMAQQGSPASAQTSGNSSSVGTLGEGNPNTCFAVFILVRSPASAIPATGGTPAPSTTPTPAVTATPTP
jgi:hypothetical protein